MLLKLFAEGEHRVPLAPAVFAEMQMLLKLMLQIIRQLAVLREDYVLLCTLTVHDAYSNQPLQRTSQSITPQRIFLTALPASGVSSSLFVSEHLQALPAACGSPGRECSWLSPRS